jgi:hypothetical protein
MDRPQSEEQRMLSEMQDALYCLGDDIREHSVKPGEKLLPSGLSKGGAEGALAKSHVRKLYAAFKATKSAKEK